MSEFDPNYVPQKNYYLVGQKCVVFNSKGEVLLLKRSSKSGSTHWSLIGGGLDKGEDPIEGIKREANEEAQIEIFDIEPIRVVSFTEGEDSVLMIAYQAKTNSIEVVLNWEHDEYKWVSKEDALKEDLSETIKDFIRSSRSL